MEEKSIKIVIEGKAETKSGRLTLLQLQDDYTRACIALKKCKSHKVKGIIVKIKIGINNEISSRMETIIKE